MTAAEDWRRAIGDWAIPQPILDAAPASPWGFPTSLFERRADDAVATLTPSNRRALEALPDGGVVLDVGCGAGAASLPLAHKAGQLIGFDPSPEMLAAFRRRARSMVSEVATLVGTWPDGADAAPAADVVVCHHVAYNVADLAAFVRRLGDHARYRVVMELTAEHPLSVLNELWLHFHGLVRPVSPTVEDAIAVLRECGYEPEREQRTAPALGPFDTLDELAESVRVRLCLPADRDPEIAAVLAAKLVRQPGGAVTYGERAVVTLWWAGRSELLSS